MEEILRKEIYNEKDLFKLSPDFMPCIPLRMEMRRHFVKDTCGSATGADGIIKPGSWPRKSIKKTKGCYKFNKEIVKIRNNFLNLDLKNKMMLKYIDSIKPKVLTNNDKLLIKGNATEIAEEENIFMHEITEDMRNLVINSDIEFKLNEKTVHKPKLSIQNNEITPINKSTLQNDTENKEDDDGLDLNILRVECRNIFSEPKGEMNEIIENCRIEDESEEVHTDLMLCSTDNTIVGKDLHSILVMMALTPKSFHNIEKQDSNPLEYYDHDEHNEEIINEVVDTVQVALSYRSKIEEDDMTNLLCVAPMRIKINVREEFISKKYIKKWKKFVTHKKEELLQQRQYTLNNFFDKLSKKKMQIHEGPEFVKKAKLLAQDCNTYQRRYKIQKHIIALQRAKLEEQNRVIEELKYNKIVDASKQSVDALKAEVRQRYCDIDRQLKPKIKMLTNELKLDDIQDQSLVLHCLKVPQFLQRMEKRAREREEKHAMIRERRRQMEEERIRLKQQAELAKAEMDKEEKMKRINELRQKRKREKIEMIRKKQYAARLRALIVMADLHYEKYLLTKYGLRPFKILIAMKRDSIEKAKAHYLIQLKNNVFLNWMWYTEDMWYERNFKADDFHRKKLLRKGIIAFRKNTRQYILQKQVADDYYDLYVTQLIFRKFREGIEVIRKENEIKWKRAIAYHNSNILFKTFICWRTLPALNALKREQDARKARWREKVLQVVPDYTPPED